MRCILRFEGEEDVRPDELTAILPSNVSLIEYYGGNLFLIEHDLIDLQFLHDSLHSSFSSGTWIISIPRSGR